MRTIIAFNDNTPEAENAMEFAINMAAKVAAEVWVLNLCGMPRKKEMETVSAVGDILSVKANDVLAVADYLPYQFAADNTGVNIVNIDAARYTEKEICEMVIRERVWLMVKGVETHVTHETIDQVNVQSILNRVASPLLLIPCDYLARDFKNITYAVDMRYCRVNVTRFLAELAEAYNANLIIEHLSASGLPPLDDDYAMSLFCDAISSKIKYENVYFNNIKERNLEVAIDVMIHSLHADMLALVNHRFHFEELFGMAIKNVLPGHIEVPVMVFPLQ
ncbi:MAG: hypothetical protein JST19_04675 [Bacteroidetes bacterium]|nr:hypothetical protein [Bacteroidota bacterium]